MPKAEADMVRKLYKQNLADYVQLYGNTAKSPLGITSAQALVPSNSCNRQTSDHSPASINMAAIGATSVDGFRTATDISQRQSHDAESIFLSALVDAGSTCTLTKEKQISTRTQTDSGSVPLIVEDFPRLNRILTNFPYNAALSCKLSSQGTSPIQTGSHRRICGESGQTSKTCRPTSAPSMRMRRDSYAIDRLAERLHVVTSDLMRERKHRAELEARLLQNNEVIFKAAYSQARVMVLAELREALLTTLAAPTGELPAILSDAFRELVQSK